VTPDVTPPATPSPHFVPFLRLRQERFIVHADTATGLGGGTVFATGPIAGTGTRVQVTPTDDTWNLTGPTGTFNVLHSRVGTPVIDPATCTASLDQTGRWAILGPGRAFGFGTFRLSLRAILARGPFGFCLFRVRPLWVDVQVLGTGRAAILRLGLHRPYMTPELTPAAAPSGYSDGDPIPPARETGFQTGDAG
jgi:hypothetical protein